MLVAVCTGACVDAGILSSFEIRDEQSSVRCRQTDVADTLRSTDLEQLLSSGIPDTCGDTTILYVSSVVHSPAALPEGWHQVRVVARRPVSDCRRDGHRENLAGTTVAFTVGYFAVGLRERSQ